MTCFLAQQAAEKAIKAFLYLSEEERVLGHSAAGLLIQ
ncbi:HEPN domain-containing protein [Methanoculleus bourgensis]